MSETWKRWEGRTIGGLFPLQSYLGGSDHSAVFLTTRKNETGDSEKAAIKLISADRADAGEQLQRWQSARALSHPNLIRIFESGRGKLDGTKLLYVVEECAEENLAQILPERALTADETRGMLLPVLHALDFVHSKGLVHGHIQPSNIFAVGDQVKLSSDGLSVPGENGGAPQSSAYGAPESASSASTAAGDVWQLGATLVEVLTQRIRASNGQRTKAPEIPAALTEPFREIAARCLQIDPGKRWTIADILERLGERRRDPIPAPGAAPIARASSEAGIPSPRKVSAKWSYLLAVAAILAIAFIFIPRPKASNPLSGDVSSSAQQGAAGTTAPGQQESSSTATTSSDRQDGVVQRVVPEISQRALRSIHGVIQVRVKVKVDPAGSVDVVKLESGRANKYFKRIALDAARDWKFVPAPSGEPGAREWTLQFAFSRGKTEASVLRGKQ
jgi:TonB family protein